MNVGTRRTDGLPAVLPGTTGSLAWPGTCCSVAIFEGGCVQLGRNYLGAGIDGHVSFGVSAWVVDADYSGPMNV